MPLLAAPGPRLCGLCELRYAMGERLCCCCICSWCSLQPKEIPASAVSTSTHAAACAPAALFSLLPPSFAGPLLLPRLALLLLLLQPSCFFSGSTALRNTSSCFSVLVLCFSESSKQMRAANKSEKGSPLLPFALLDLPLPWQLLSLLSRSRFPGKSPARKARPSSRQIPIWISPYERLRARLVLRPADGLFFVSGGRQCSRCCGSGSGPGCLLLLFLLAGVL